jgi:hypothetical protein
VPAIPVFVDLEMLIWHLLPIEILEIVAKPGRNFQHDSGKSHEEYRDEFE